MQKASAQLALLDFDRGVRLRRRDIDTHWARPPTWAQRNRRLVGRLAPRDGAAGLRTAALEREEYGRRGEGDFTCHGSVSLV
jgi:hypothetical protein